MLEWMAFSILAAVFSDRSSTAAPASDLDPAPGPADDPVWVNDGVACWPEYP